MFFKDLPLNKDFTFYSPEMQDDKTPIFHRISPKKYYEPAYRNNASQVCNNPASTEVFLVETEVTEAVKAAETTVKVPEIPSRGVSRKAHIAKIVAKCRATNKARRASRVANKKVGK